MAISPKYKDRVRQALESQASIGVDLLVIVGIAGLLAAAVMVFGQVSAPMRQQVYINLSLWSLPKYVMFSLARGIAAYIISLVFTLIYGTIAAHNHTAEKIMIPALDILQSIPVLGFLPGLVLAMISLFPSREFGLELACVIMIFTAQAWNMTFSFHGSLRSIPTALREVAAINGLTGWQIFRLLEVPAAMIGLVWNSMMSMAGGWFFLSVNEAFQLTIHGVSHDFRLPGIGSYMSEAMDQGNTKAQIGAVVAMIIMIVVVDQVIWRPIVVWSQRFQMGDTAASEQPKSWVVDLFRHSKLLRGATRWLGRRKANPVVEDASPIRPKFELSKNQFAWIKRLATWMMVFILAGSAAWGAVRLIGLLIHIPIHDRSTQSWTEREDWIMIILALLASFARVSAAVIIGTAWTLPLGIIIGLSPKWSHRLQPVTQVLASFPAPMLFPWVFAILVFAHIDFTVGCTVLMLLGAQWYILFNVIAGASAIPPELKEAGIVYHMDRAKRWKEIYLPSVFPYLVTGLVTAAGGAWNATIVAEALTINKSNFYAFGLGSVIYKSADHEKYALLAAAVVTMSVFVVLFNRVVWKRLYRLAESRYSLNV
jgi:NitT/TauT family transport system permease protein